MSADKKTSANGSKDGFEAEMAKLEKLVESLESGTVSLDELVTKYEEGMRLLKSCQANLQAAELRIEQLGKKSNESEQG
jgi:exodeoxyribonuclease VII small subunit